MDAITDKLLERMQLILDEDFKTGAIQADELRILLHRLKVAEDKVTKSIKCVNPGCDQNCWNNLIWCQNHAIEVLQDDLPDVTKGDTAQEIVKVAQMIVRERYQRIRFFTDDRLREMALQAWLRAGADAVTPNLFHPRDKPKKKHPWDHIMDDYLKIRDRI